tara:strand:- start:18 stop:308 length:291 start_codon:yes stop_codon:yes gene_type:complete
MATINDLSIYAKHILLQLPRDEWKNIVYLHKRIQFMIKQCQDTYDTLSQYNMGSDMLTEKQQWENMESDPYPYLDELVANGWIEKQDGLYRQIAKN